ncbi:caprin-1-like [Panonychus citri]|uniref:caprin-1-like n=1 Tax=Panonychus citri TaxID=50023 RepID=UPI00230804DE|nr:caprin-1-like [Panonychus citri]
MPSVTNPNKVDRSTLPDPHQEPLNKVQLLVDNKIRNLEKRKSRLEQYRDEAKAGKELNLDQRKAVKRYEEVTEMLDFFREFKKNVQTIFADHVKQMKKLARKERPTRDPKEIERLRLVFLFHDLLGNLNADVKNDFIKGTNGAIQLTEDKIQHLEEFSKIVDSERSKVDEANKNHTKTAERYLALVEGIRSDAFKGTSYKELKETLLSISDSGYFEKSTSISVSATNAVSKSSLSSATSQPQQPQVAETGNLSRVTDDENLSRPNFESSPIQPIVSNDSQAPVKPDISGVNKYQSQPSHPSHQSQHQNKPRNPNSNQPGLQEMLSNVGGPGVGNPVAAPPNSYNFLQESRLEMENAPHMDPAVVAMAPVTGAYSAAYGNNQSVEALAAQFASTCIPPMSSVNNMTKDVTTFETTGPNHQPIPTQTFTNQRFTAMMTGGTFVQPVPIANPSLLGLPVQLTGQTMNPHQTGSNEQMTSNQSNNDNQNHGMTMAALGQSMLAGYGPEVTFTQYQAPHQQHDNSRNNQGPSRDKQSYQGDDNQGGYGSNYGRYRRGGGRGGGGGDRNSGPPRANKYNSSNGYSSRGRGGGPGVRSSGKPQDNKPKNISDNRNVSNQWS